MKNLKLPKSVRPLLKRPFGELLKGEGLRPALEVKKRLSGERIIVIGDMTLKNLLEVGVKPNLSIIDKKTKREITSNANIKNAVRVKNPPGMLTRELLVKIKEFINKDKTILVEGEEDLAVMPCVVEASLGSAVLYGQPDEGIVYVKVTTKAKEEAGEIMSLMEAVDED